MLKIYNINRCKSFQLKFFLSRKFKFFPKKLWLEPTLVLENVLIPRIQFLNLKKYKIYLVTDIIYFSML